MEKELKKALLEIHQSELEPLVKNLTLVLDKLIELLVTSYKIGGQLLSLGPTVFETLCLVSNKLGVNIRVDEINADQHGRQPLVCTYVQYQCKIPHPLSGKSELLTSQNGEEFER